MEYLIVIGIIVLFYMIGRQVHIRKEQRELAYLEDQIAQTMFVTVEKHAEKSGTVFLMFTLLDDTFLMQATSAAELVTAAKLKYPNKRILVSGTDDILLMPEFNETDMPFTK